MKKSIKFIILIIIGIIFFVIGLKEELMGIYIFQIILYFLKTIASFLVSILAFIVILMDLKKIKRKNKILEIIITLLCFIVILISFCQVTYYYEKNKGFIDYPSELLQYKYNDVNYKLQIDDIEVENSEEGLLKKKTNYKITLKSENITRIVYICIERKYSLRKLKWETVKREYYKTEEIKINNTYHDIKEEYKKIIQSFNNNEEEMYALSDLNSDGIEELLIISGISEADKKISCYTYDNNKTIFCGSTWSTHSSYFEENHKNYITKIAYMQGGEILSHLFLENKELIEQIIYDKDVSNGEQFEISDQEIPIKFVEISDLSVLDDLNGIID